MTRVQIPPGALPSYAAQKRNSKLTQFKELKDAVIANTVKNVPEAKKGRKQGEDRSLDEFGRRCRKSL